MKVGTELFWRITAGSLYRDGPFFNILGFIGIIICKIKKLRPIISDEEAIYIISELKKK